MRFTTLPAALASAMTLTVLMSGCATAPRPTAPDVPTALRPPADQAVFLEALASGVQIYECAAKAAPASGFEWVFKAPDASLSDRAGHAIGKHYAGPTWESVDASTVVGEVKARDPGPTPATAIPWLLLASKANTGSGVFSQVKSVQRVQTVGGIVPTDPCTGSTIGQKARVPYTATYFFYRNAL